MNNKKFIPIILILLIAIPIIATALDKDDVFTSLKDNKDTGEAIFTLDNPELSNLQETALTISFNEECGEVISYQILTLQTCYKPIPTYKTQKVCYTTTNNKTLIETITCRDQQIKTGEIITPYPCYKPTPYIYSGIKDYKIDANIKLEKCLDGSYGYKIDWIPKLTIDGTTYEKTEWAWWNASFSYRRNVNTTGLSSNIGFIINGSNCFKQNGSKQCIRTDNTGNISIYYNDLTDILVAVNDTTKNPYYYETGNGTSWNQPQSFGKKIVEFYDFEETGSGVLDKVNSTINYTLGVATRDTTNYYAGNNSFKLGMGVGESLTDYGIEPEEFKAYCFAFYLDSKGGASSTSIIYLMSSNGINNIYLGFGKDDGVSIWYNSGGWFNTGGDMSNVTWDYYCINEIDFVNTNYSLYKNAVLVANIPMGTSALYDGTIRNLMHTGFTPGSSYNLDELTFYNEALTADEINESYHNYLTTVGRGNLIAQEAPPSDTQAPVITNNFPLNNTQSTTQTPTFNFTYIDDQSNGTCNIQANGTLIGNITAINNTATTIISNTTLENNSWYHWNITCTDGTNTNESITWDLFISTCVENWTATYTACNISDQRIKTYTDEQGCGHTFDLPVDNNTNVSCNYCSEDLVQALTPCSNGTQNVTYTDNNFIPCCFVTNIISDCSVIYTPPFNESTPQNCTGVALINNFTCSLDQEPILHDKINIICEMPDNQTYCCLTNTFQGTNLLATSPEYQDVSDGLLSLRSEEETRECFTPRQRLLNAYYTPKNVRTDTQFKMQVLCTSTNGTSIRSEYLITPSYDKPDWIFNRMVWAKENAWELVGVAILLILIAIFLGYLYKKSKTGI